MLTVGFASGNVECYVLTPDRDFARFKLYTTIKGHKKPLVAVQTQGVKSNVISISKENIMAAFDISSETNYKIDGKPGVNKETALNSNLTCLFYDAPADRLLVGTSSSEFYLYAFSVNLFNQHSKFSLEAKIEGGQESDLVLFYIEPNRKYLFVAYKNGVINVYEVHGLMRSHQDFKHISAYEIKNEVALA